MKKIVLIAILMVTGISSAQIKLTGVVKDSIGDPLEMANVIAIDTVTKGMASYGFYRCERELQAKSEKKHCLSN